MVAYNLTLSLVEHSTFIKYPVPISHTLYVSEKSIKLPYNRDFLSFRAKLPLLENTDGFSVRVSR